jgi:hypothetical protein
VAEKIGDRPRLQPGPREKFAAHEEEVRPGHCQQAHERPADGQGEQPLQERDGHADDGEFSELDEAARHRAVRTVPCIFVGVLELVGDPQQQERAERTQERHDKRQRGRPPPQQRRVPHRRGAERRDQRPVRKQRETFLLVDPPAVHAERKGGFDRG